MSIRKMEDKLKELKSQGTTVYSISRLNAFNDCQYNFYKTYIQGDRGENNIYGLAGSAIHQHIEDIYNNQATKEDLIKGLDDILNECDLFGIKFPSEKIAENWKKDMYHFANNFKKMNKDILTERFILYEIEPGIWLQGFIDGIAANKEDNSLIILDWKSSSEFKGDKLLKAGRQLLIYKEAIENTTNFKVSKCGWAMLKYINVTYKGKTKMCSRRKWVKDFSNKLKKDLKKLGEDDIVIEMMVETAVDNNNLDNMPEEIQDKYKLEDAIVWYEATDKLIKECKDYIVDTVKEIESKDSNNEDEWKPVELNRKTEFFCKFLCSHRSTCKYLKEYLNDGKEEKDDLASLF